MRAFCICDEVCDEVCVVTESKSSHLDCWVCAELLCVVAAVQTMGVGSVMQHVFHCIQNGQCDGAQCPCGTEHARADLPTESSTEFVDCRSGPTVADFVQ